MTCEKSHLENNLIRIGHRKSLNSQTHITPTGTLLT